MAGPNLANLPCLGFTIDKGMAIIAKIKQAKMDTIVYARHAATINLIKTLLLDLYFFLIENQIIYLF